MTDTPADINARVKADNQMHEEGYHGPKDRQELERKDRIAAPIFGVCPKCGGEMLRDKVESHIETCDGVLATPPPPAPTFPKAVSCSQCGGAFLEADLHSHEKWCDGKLRASPGVSGLVGPARLTDPPDISTAQREGTALPAGLRIVADKPKISDRPRIVINPNRLSEVSRQMDALPEYDVLDTDTIDQAIEKRQMELKYWQAVVQEVDLPGVRFLAKLDVHKLMKICLKDIWDALDAGDERRINNLRVIHAGIDSRASLYQEAPTRIQELMMMIKTLNTQREKVDPDSSEL